MEFLEALGPFAGSLRSLSLFMGSSGRYSPNGPDLSSFKLLQHLTLSVASWYPWEDESASTKKTLVQVLPPTICSLTVIAGEAMDWTDKLDQELLAIAQRQLQDPKPFPNLHHVEYVVNEHTLWLNALQDAFSAVSIVFRAAQDPQRPPPIENAPNLPRSYICF